MQNIIQIQGIIFLVLCLISLCHGQCKGLAKGSEDLDQCLEGNKSTEDYRKLDVAEDIYRVYQDLLQEVNYKNCDKNCKPNKNTRSRRTCTPKRLVCEDDPCDKNRTTNPSQFEKCLMSKKPDSRRKRSDLVDKHWWRCDFPVQSCCRTCRRTIPMVEPMCVKYKTPRKRKCQAWVYPVFCPRKGGFQLIDDVHCLKQNCRKPCKKETTFYTFLVTEVPWKGWEGHCQETWISVWFKTKEVDSHCTCPREKRVRG